MKTFADNTKFPTPLAVANYVSNELSVYTHTDGTTFTNNLLNLQPH